MIKAVFLDFYGTVVHEDGEVVKKVTQEIFATGEVANKSDVGSYWWNEFQRMFFSANGADFKTQRELEYQSLNKTVHHFKSVADAKVLSELMFEHWVQPPAFAESHQFFAMSPVPVFIVSNIDRADILQAVKFHDFKPRDIFTSEDARSYKPDKGLFEFALKNTGYSADQVVHIGDSLSSDVKGASTVGINAIWINRSGKEVPPGVCAVDNLLKVFETDFFK